MSDNEENQGEGVSNVLVDSLEFDVNTNLPLTPARTSPWGAAPSLQELIEAELNTRRCQLDSLEVPAGPPSCNSLLSYDSIEPVPNRPTAACISLDSLISLNHSPCGELPERGADEESGIDILSPMKVDDFSNPDSLESSSDLPGSIGHSSPEPSTPDGPHMTGDTLVNLNTVTEVPSSGLIQVTNLMDISEESFTQAKKEQSTDIIQNSQSNSNIKELDMLYIQEPIQINESVHKEVNVSFSNNIQVIEAEYISEESSAMSYRNEQSSSSSLSLTESDSKEHFYSHTDTDVYDKVSRTSSEDVYSHREIPSEPQLQRKAYYAETSESSENIHTTELSASSDDVGCDTFSLTTNNTDQELEDTRAQADALPDVDYSSSVNSILKNVSDDTKNTQLADLVEVSSCDISSLDMSTPQDQSPPIVLDSPKDESNIIDSQSTLMDSDQSHIIKSSQHDVVSSLSMDIVDLDSATLESSSDKDLTGCTDYAPGVRDSLSSPKSPATLESSSYRDLTESTDYAPGVRDSLSSPKSPATLESPSDRDLTVSTEYAPGVRDLLSSPKSPEPSRTPLDQELFSDPNSLLIPMASLQLNSPLAPKTPDDPQSSADSNSPTGPNSPMDISSSLGSVSPTEQSLPADPFSPFELSFSQEPSTQTQIETENSLQETHFQEDLLACTPSVEVTGSISPLTHTNSVSVSSNLNDFGHEGDIRRSHDDGEDDNDTASSLAAGTISGVSGGGDGGDDLGDGHTMHDTVPCSNVGKKYNKYQDDESASDYFEEEEEEQEEEIIIEEKKEEETKVNGEVAKQGDEENEDGGPAENGDAHPETTAEKKKKKKKKDGEKKSKKKKKDKGSSDTDSEEEEEPAPTPPLFNGHALTNGVIANHRHQGDVNHEESRRLLAKDYQVSETESQSDHEFIGREEFHSLRDVYSGRQESVVAASSGRNDLRAQTTLTDEEELAGVSVKQLRSSYLHQAQEKKIQQQHNQVIENHRVEVNKSINITSLVDTYSSPPPRTPTPSRPDDLTPVSLRSLKSAYEASATGSSGAVSRHSSSSCGSPGGGSPAPKEELNISLHQLREEYCRSVQDGHIRAITPTRSSPETGVSIRHLQAPQVSNDCKKCGKQVFQMEKIVAEKASWHKNCFRCAECNCILTLETYQSHEGILYCKVHFKALFQPKAVLEDPGEKYRSRKPKMIILESQPEELPPDVVRSGNRTEDPLEDLSTVSLKNKFMMFEAISTTDEDLNDPVSVRRSQSLLSKARGGEDDYGVENSELGEYDEEEEEEEEEDDDDDEEELEGDENGDQAKIRKKVKATSFSGMQDIRSLKAAKKRKEMMAKNRREEVAKFRMMLCAGKNTMTREYFEGVNIDDVDFEKNARRQQIKLERANDASELRDRFEAGEGLFDKKQSSERQEVEEVFKEAETASRARNLFKQIDSAANQEEELGPLRRSRSTAEARKENRLSMDGIDVEDQELGRDPNYVRCTDNYEDEVDCRKTKSVLAMFRKMEMQNEDDENSPRPLKQFTPPPEGEEYSDEDEYTDEEYSSEEDEDEDEEDEDDDGLEKKPIKYKDEILEMVQSSQSARKAASLRAKFEMWEGEVGRNNEHNEDDEECMPSIDTARNLRAMFENKAQEATRPVTERPKMKVNRFVGGGGDNCMLCDRTVYAMERLEVAGRVLHKNCFKCCKCNTKLSMNTFSIGGEDMYCTTHYKQAFTEKGTYDVFTPNKGKWTRKIEATNSESPKSQE